MIIHTSRHTYDYSSMEYTKEELDWIEKQLQLLEDILDYESISLIQKMMFHIEEQETIIAERDEHISYLEGLM